MTIELFAYSDKQLLTHCCCNVGLGDNYETVHMRKTPDWNSSVLRFGYYQGDYRDTPMRKILPDEDDH